MKHMLSMSLLLGAVPVLAQDAVDPVPGSAAPADEPAGLSQPTQEASEVTTGSGPENPGALPVFRARQTAHLLPTGTSQWGIFGPYYRGLKNGVELELRPLVFTLMASPNFIARKGVKKSGLWTVAGEVGMSLPTLGMRMWQGGDDNPLPLPVSLYGRADTIPWILAPRVGLLASRGTTDADVLTLRADLTMAIPFGEGNFSATEHWLLGLLLAPVDTGYRARLSAAYDRPLSPRVRLRTRLDLYGHGAQPDQFRALGKLGLEFAAWRSASGAWRRVGIGMAWLNSDSYGVNAERQRVRSNDFLPLFDVVF